LPSTEDVKVAGSLGNLNQPLSAELRPGQSATLEELQRIRTLKSQGFSEYAARVEVLAKGHPLDCDCEVCG
jgi:hypothetical protein